MKRNYGLDLLRIFCMAMIVLRHGVYQSGVTRAEFVDTAKLNYLCGVFVNDVTAIAVNCFVLITGYFLSRQTFRAGRLVSLWGTVLFYSLGVYAAALLCAGMPFSAAGALRALTPLCSYTYWFISLYFLVVLVSPLLNAAAERALDGRMLAVLLVVFSLLPTFGIDHVGAEHGYSFGWFAVLYLTGAWLRRAADAAPVRRTDWRALLGYLVLTAFSFAYLLARKALKARGLELTPADDYNFLPTFLASVCAFRFFASLEIRPEPLRRAIAFLAPLVLGVYLLHDHYLKHALWHDLLGLDAYRASAVWLVQVPARIAAVFAAGCAVEWLRARLAALFRKRAQPAKQNS